MRLIKVAAAIVNQTPLDWKNNQKNLTGVLRAAREEGVSLLCLPEMSICGYNCEDAFHGLGVRDASWKMLEALLDETRGMIVSFGLPVSFRNAMINTSCLVADGRILGFVGKRYLAGDGIHYEPRWFKPWPRGEQAELHVAGNDYPLGDIYFECGGIGIGYEICEDAWVAERPGGYLSRHGIDIILNPSASHFAFGKSEIRKRFVLEGSRAYGVTYIYSNLLGNEAGRAIYDGGALIASGGALIASGPRFSYAEWHLTSAIVDVETTRQSQIRTASFEPDFTVDERSRVSCAFEFPELEPLPIAPSPAGWESGQWVKEEEFTRAVSLGLFDYMRKSRSDGFVVSLSGGADSAACSCLVALMVDFAMRDLGAERFFSRLSYSKSLAALGGDESSGDSRQKIVRGLLTCVYQATRNSSSTTLEAARTIAEAIGADFMTFDIDELVERYVAVVEKGIGRELDWKTDDTTLQNIQARVRSPGIWMIANIRNALLLATSNRSEAAVGYTTMDGDTSGGLSPIAGIDKAFLRSWLRWLEKIGPAGSGPLPAVAVVNVLEPTAELRPQELHQTDEADLMPYPILDAIERAAIRDKQTPLDVFRELRSSEPARDPRQLAAWVERFFKLWCRNQWKRERYAPSFHVDDENLDPKSWCRFPILSGGFELELEELRAYVTDAHGAK